MKLSRGLLASFALPAALSLAACGGGSTTFNNATSTTSSVRFVNGAPALGSVDVYFTSSGTTASSTPLLAALAYAQISDFSSQNSASATIVLRPAGSAATATPSGGCTVPQLSNNGKYSVVFFAGGAGQPATCGVYQDFDYSAAGQYRVHHASPAAATAGNSTISFGLTNGTAQPTFTIAGTAAFPGNSGVVSLTSVGVQNAVAAGTPVGFAIGASGQTGATATTLAQVNANQIVAPGGTANVTASPDTANTLPGGGFNNASIFAIDTPTGGTQLIASFDSK